MGWLSSVNGQGMGIWILVPFPFQVVLGTSTSAGFSGTRCGLENVGR